MNEEEEEEEEEEGLFKANTVNEEDPEEDVRDESELFDSEGGIGVVMERKRDGGTYVTFMAKEGSASRSGLVQVGDCLMKIDGNKVFGKSVQNVMRYLHGPSGSVAEFEFRRWTSGNSKPTTYSVMLTRNR